MILRTKLNRQSTVAFSRTEQLIAGRATMLIPGLRRTAHSPGDFRAEAILVPVSVDVNTNVAGLGDGGIISGIHASAAAVFMEETTMVAEAAWAGAARSMAALDDDDEDEDEDDYDDDDLDEEDDEDLDDEDDEEYDDDLDDEDEDGDLDDDDLDDEDEDDGDEDE